MTDLDTKLIAVAGSTMECPDCHGTGDYWSAGRIENPPNYCPVCKGTGRIKKGEPYGSKPAA